jgi:hypothetical protein
MVEGRAEESRRCRRMPELVLLVGHHSVDEHNKNTKYQCHSNTTLKLFNKHNKAIQGKSQSTTKQTIGTFKEFHT